MKTLRGCLALLFVLGSLLVVAPGRPIGAETGQFRALVTIPPQAFLVESIAGDRVEVTSLVPEGGSPHSAGLTPGNLEAVRRAEVYFRVGTSMGFEENHMSAIRDQNPDLRLVNTSEGVELKTLDEHYGAGKEETKEGKGAADPHVWLSPANLKIMAENVYEGLVEVDPSAREYYEKNRRKLVERISAVQEKTRGLTADFRGRSFIAYHPAWGYFGDEFDLRQVAVEEKGDEPGPRRIKEVADFARKRGIERIISSYQFGHSTAETVARQFGGSASEINPMEEDILEEIVRLAEEISEGYSRN